MPSKRPTSGKTHVRIDRNRLAALLTKHEPAVRHLLRQHLSPANERHVSMDDLVQEVWTAAVLKCEDSGWDGEVAFGRWLIKVTRLRCCLNIRMKRTQKRDGTVRSLKGLSGELISPDPTPSRDASASEAVAAIHEAIDQLPPLYGRVVRLRHIEGRSIAEIAAATQLTIPSIHSRLFRASRQLRKRLGSAGQFFSDADSSENPLA